MLPFSQEHHRVQRTTGLAYIFATAVIWTAASFISQSLVSDGSACDDPTKKNPNATIPPFVLTYLATTLFVVYLPIVYTSRWLKKGNVQSPRPTFVQVEHVPEFRDVSDATSLLPSAPVPGSSKWAHEDREAFFAALWGFPLWFFAQWLFNQSLAWTSVTSNTILSSTSSLFAFLLSLVLLGEQYTTRKLLCVMLCIAGTVLVAMSDDGQNDGCNGGQEETAVGSLAVAGDLMAVLSAAFYATYTVMMRKMMPDEGTASVGLFFGYIGLFSFVVFGPVVLGMMWLGTFHPALVPRQTYGLILLEGALDYVLADYLWARAVLLIGPTIATLGLSVQVPIATAADLVLGDPAWTHGARTAASMLSGALLILVAFFGINLGQQPDAGLKVGVVRVDSTEGRGTGAGNHGDVQGRGVGNGVGGLQGRGGRGGGHGRAGDWGDGGDGGSDDVERVTEERLESVAESSDLRSLSVWWRRRRAGGEGAGAERGRRGAGGEASPLLQHGTSPAPTGIL